MEARHYSDRIAIAANQNVKEREYWLKQLSGELKKSHFHYDCRGIKAKEPGDRIQATETFGFSDDLLAKLGKISSGIDIKLHMILTANLVLLLNKYTGDKDILTGSPVLKQDIEADFINRVLVFRSRLEDKMSFKDLLLQVRETVVRASENQNFPIEVLPDLLKIPILGNEFPLFDVVLILESIHDKNYLSKVDYDMLFSFSRSPEHIEGVVEYNSLHHTQRMTKQIINHFTRLMDLALSDLNMKLTDIDMLSAQEKQQLLDEFNANDGDFPQDKTFQQLFEEQVEKTSENIALVAQDTQGVDTGKLSYNQLNRKANRLAGRLKDRGVTADAIVAIMAERSLDMIVGVLAILKAGGAYLPLDPEYPAGRIEFMLADSTTSLLVTQNHLRDKINFKGSIITIEDNQSDCAGVGNLETGNSPDDLVYVIYTSGSTGEPKGVMVQHNHFINLAYGWREEYRLQEIEVNLLQMVSFSFDVFAGDLARTFLNGGKMVITPALAMDPETLYELIKNHRITLFESTPSYIIPFMKYIYENNLKIDHLRLLILGSDTCSFRDYKELVARFGKQMRIINSYGVTEATIDSSYYEEYCQEKMPSLGIVPIGKPLPNVKFYILDPAGKLLPVGVPGELYIGGRSVSRGYLYREKLSVERFLPNPFVPGQHMYRTGDLARWLPDGNVEFIGRVDYQVKVRGYRIELGEIECKLVEHPDIKEAVVVEKSEESGDKYLCGYFVSDETLNPADLRDYLRQKLPDYMVPWFFIQLEKLPLTANGKIDRKSLPELPTSEQKEYVAPRNKTEEDLLEIWSQVLAEDREKIGIDSNFFDLGGNSLKAIVISSRIHKKFDVKVVLVDIFRLQTIRKLAEYICKNNAALDRYTAIKAAEMKEYYRLSSAQKRLFVVQQLEPDSTGYNMPLRVVIEGDPDRKKFELTFKKLIARHEILRTSFEVLASEPIQKINQLGDLKFSINYYDSNEEEARRIVKDFVRPFDLSQAPLLRVALVNVREADHAVLVVDMHHIVSDGISHQILKRDFLSLYEGVELQPLRIQYKDFSEWQNSEKERRTLKQQEDFWVKELSGNLPVLDIETDFPRPTIQSFIGSTVAFRIDGEMTQALKAFAREEEATLQMLLLTIFNILLFKISGQEDIIVGTSVSERRHVDLENVIGMFANALALRNFPSGEKSFLEFLREVRKNSLNAYENQDVQFDDLVGKVLTNRDTSRNPLFDVMFEIQAFGLVLQDKPVEKKEESRALKLSPYEIGNKTTKIDLDWLGVETGDGLFFTVDYCTELYKKETVEKLIERFKEVLKQAMANKKIKLRDITLSHGFQEAKSTISTTDRGDFKF